MKRLRSVRHHFLRGFRAVKALWLRRRETSALYARQDGGSVSVSRGGATLRPGTSGGAVVEYRVGDAGERGVPLLVRHVGSSGSDDPTWQVVQFFATAGRASRAMRALVLPPPSFRFSWRAAVVSAVVVAISLSAVPQLSPQLRESIEAGGVARQLSPVSPAVARPLVMPQPNIQAPPLAAPDDQGMSIDLEEFMACAE